MILEAVFPTRCVGCGADGAWLCSDCGNAIELVSGTPCPACGSLKREHECQGGLPSAPTPISVGPVGAHGNAPLAGLVAIGFYHDPRLRALVHGLKYSNATCLLPSFRSLLARFKSERRDPWPWAGERDIGIQHVPGAPDRIRARGFDQAELLRGIVKEDIVPWAADVSRLVRTKTVKVQADLEPGPLRDANVAKTFGFTQGSDPVPSAVILVDDVFTTGATMRAAARVLMSNGAERVYGFAFALGA